MTISNSTDFSVILDNVKTTYAKKLKDYRPNYAILQEVLPANRDGIEVGATLKVPVLLTHQGGESYDTAGGTSTLNQPISVEIKDASTDQFEITEVVRIPIGVLSKLGQSGNARFADNATLRMLAGQKGAARALELSLLHGGNGLGQVASVGSVTGSANAFSLAVTFTPGSWSDGIWGAAENAPFDFYSALTSGTKRNSGGDTSVTAVNFTTRTVTFLSTQATNADLAAIAAGDFVFSKGSYGKQMPGLMNVVSTTSGSLFGLSTNYSMYKAKQVTVSNSLTFGKIVSGIAPAVAHGAEGTLTGFCSPRNWADLMKDLTSTRRSDVSYSTKEMKNGSQAIQYFYSGGQLDIAIHPYMKDGEFVVIPVDNWFRVGSDPDPTMDIAGLELQVMSSTTNAFDFRFFCASALIPNLLATSTYFSGITPAAS
jgi:hypothetical protein